MNTGSGYCQFKVIYFNLEVQLWDSFLIVNFRMLNVRVFKVLKNCKTQNQCNGNSKENLQKPTLLQSSEVPNCIIC